MGRRRRDSSPPRRRDIVREPEISVPPRTARMESYLSADPVSRLSAEG